MQRHCIYCDRDVAAWLPFHITEADVSPFLWRVGITGSNVARFQCPHCHSNDRERHLRLYLDRLNIWNKFANASVLHMAPEFYISKAIKDAGPARHILGDLSPQSAEVEKIDLEAIPAPDAAFDFVICNHVLEHVNRPEVALSEAHRVLRPGGRFISQTPFAAKLSTTLEDPLLQSASDRLFFYGQDDHLRLFGIDIEVMILSAGFRGKLRSHDTVLPDVDPESAGVNELEPFFDFVRA